MDLDPQSIERRDFPIARRGYDPAAVDAHLRALAAEVDELQRRQEGSLGGESLGSAAASRVQSILDAAEATAGEIERRASEEAGRTREEATRDAQGTRTEAVARAQAHVGAVSQATAVLLERVESMDREVGALVDSLRTGAGRMAADLGSVETTMGELYDAVAGRTTTAPTHEPEHEPEHELEPGHELEHEPEPEPEREQEWAEPVTEQIPPVLSAHAPFASAPMAAPAEPAVAGAAPLPRAVPTPALGGDDPDREWPVSVAPQVDDGGRIAAANGDLDGARLVALNMALNGEPREQADRYLAENFQLADRAKLLDEVYAAIEG